MPRTRPTARALRLFALAALLLLCARAADAAPQTFVSNKGDDNNPCSSASPCRTFTGALLKTDVGGEVAVLDSGEYGRFTINYSMKITAVGVYAGVTSSDWHAIHVKPSAGSVIALRGLTITGGGNYNGIAYDGPGVAREGDPSATLHVENCTISGFQGTGIQFYGNGSLLVKDTTVRNNAMSGIELHAPQGEKIRATIVNSRLDANYSALFAHSEDPIEVTVRDTVAADNKDVGFSAQFSGVRMRLQGCVSSNQNKGVSSTYGARLSVEDCTLSNTKYGVYATEGGAVRISNTTVTDNEVGIANVIYYTTHGHVYTFGNNRVFGNKLETEGKPSLVVKEF